MNKKQLSFFISLALFIGLSFAQSADATTILSQTRVMPAAPLDTITPSPWNDVSSDPRCSSGSCVQILADNFIMPSSGSIEEITIWGGYWHNSTPPATEVFNMFFYNDSEGTIGTSITDPSFTFTRSNIGTVKQNWGGGITTTTEFEYTFTLDTPVSLDTGNYWIEFYGDTTGHTSDNVFFSRFGTLDTTNGIDGLAWSIDSDVGTNWQYDATGNIAIEISGTMVPEPISSSLFIIGGAALGFRRFRKGKTSV